MLKVCSSAGTELAMVTVVGAAATAGTGRSPVSWSISVR
jgi:hypothetical protein